MPRAKPAERASREETAAATPLDAAFKLVDSLPVPVFFKSRDGRYLGVNRAWEEFFGIAGHTFIGKAVADLYPEDPAIAERHAAMDRELYARPGRQSYEITVRARGGEMRDTIYYKATYTGADGEVAGLIGTIVDITARTRAEEALRDSEERYRRTFELAGSGLAHVSLDGRFLRVNRRLCEMLGYTEAELRALTVRDVSHPEDRDVAAGPRGRVIRGELDAVRFEKRYLHKHGRVVWASVAIAMERDASGAPLYAISVLDDITARRETDAALRESEERFRRTFELAGSGVAHIGLDRRFIRVNRKLCEILGYPEAELIGMTGRQISHPEDLDIINAQRPRLYAGEIDHVQVEKRYVRKDRSIVWVNFSMVLERDADGRPLYEIAIFDDVTRRKAAEEDLKRSNAELEQFAYVASHDLQEPLRMVSSYTQLLGRRYGDKLQGDAQEFMHYVVDGAARMKQLIEDLLAYSRVGTKGKELRPTPLEASLKRAVTNLRAAIEESGAAVTWDELPTVTIDEVQLAQLFQNLIGNALKFRGAAVPRVHVDAAEKPDHWQITIADNGIGIEPQYFERIFMLFQRLHTMGEYPGTGIGLAICKKVVERHGGTIWVSSTPGEGSRFHFTLPKRQIND